MHHALSWIVPIVLVALYVFWGLSYQSRNPDAGGEEDAET